MLTICACEKEVQLPVSGTSLGQIYISPAAGSKSVSVDYDGLWRVKSLSEWITTDVNGRKGSSAFTFSYTSNESNLLGINVTRKGAVTITDLDKNVCDTLFIIQQGIPDGTIHHTEITSEHIETTDEEQVWRVLYCNLQSMAYADAEAWLHSQECEVKAVVWNESDAATFTATCQEPCICGNGVMITGTDINHTPASDTCGIISEFRNTRIQVAGFDMSQAPQKWHTDIVALLDEGYNTTGSSDRWLVGGSLYHYSAVEAGYPETPQWYPASSGSKEFDADKYVWSNNLIDCVWMSSRGYNPTYADGDRSWRADYVYASGSAWNTVVHVEILEATKDMKHKPIRITVKY